MLSWLFGVHIAAQAESLVAEPGESIPVETAALKHVQKVAGGPSSHKIPASRFEAFGVPD
jgi:hypothetical protein